MSSSFAAVSLFPFNCSMASRMACRSKRAMRTTRPSKLTDSLGQRPGNHPVDRQANVGGPLPFVLADETLAIHPALRPDLCQPILGSRHASQVFFDVLLPDVAHRHLSSIVIRDRRGKNLLTQEHSLSVTSQCPVPKIRKECFGFVKLMVNGKVVVRFPPEFAGTAPGMLQWMGIARPHMSPLCSPQNGRSAPR